MAILMQTALLALWFAFNVYLALHWRELENQTLRSQSTQVDFVPF